MNSVLLRLFEFDSVLYRFKWSEVAILTYFQITRASQEICDDKYHTCSEFVILLGSLNSRFRHNFHFIMPVLFFLVPQRLLVNRLYRFS